MESEETPKIDFLFKKKRVKWKDLKAIERMQKGERSVEQTQLIMARFMVDADGQYLPIEKAVEILDELDGEQIEAVSRQFGESMLEAALPKANGSSSSLPSGATPSSEFPDGSQP